MSETFIESSKCNGKVCLGIFLPAPREESGSENWKSWHGWEYEKNSPFNRVQL